ncbi:MarR family winged helix-turn-helix transcriptional regulator [Vibrio mimicus]|uniref:MarR family winged helix-turn-helix transcriptional regulator n=1 Tax=Vibrio mimicus TaxID=674 RepID=UPI00165227F1|nr:MarR family transcriptional regulator [Vibrio mimicus]
MDSVGRMVSEWANEKPEMNTLPMSILHRLQRITKRLELMMAEFYQNAELTPGEFEVLMVLRRKGAPFCLVPADLQSFTLLSSGAMTNRLDKLEQKGLIVRKMSQYDRRNVEVTLTEKGLNRIERLLPEYIALQERALVGFTEAEQDRLLQQMQQWLGHYERLW